MSIKEMVHKVKNYSYIVVGASDGIIRIYANDNMRISPKPKIFFADRQLRYDQLQIPPPLRSKDEHLKVNIWADGFCTSDGVNFLAGYTSASKASIIQIAL
jgi:hypothetical protein